MKKLVVVLLMIGFLAGGGLPASAAPAAIHNDTVWSDTDGKAIKAQGGGIIYANGFYHWFGPDFGGAGDYHFYSINHYTSVSSSGNAGAWAI